MKAIILAGGLGTRLKPLTDETPKCMLPVMGKPMVTYVINRMRKYGITDITLAVSYKWEQFVDYFQDTEIKCKVQTELLGTGGAIKDCLVDNEPVLVANGDTWVFIDYADFIKKHWGPLSIAINDKSESAGTYVLEPEIFDNFSGAFSFERDVIPITPHSYYVCDGFTDMGTPEAYAKVPKDWV